MTELFLGFIGGLIAVYFAYFLEKNRETKQKINQAQFSIYMFLMELDGYYWSIAGAEFRGERFDPVIQKRAKDIAWQIADKLREEERVKLLPETLHVLLSEAAYPSAQERYQALRELIAKMGAHINPDYKKIVEKISSENIIVIKQKTCRTAPGLFL